MKGESVPHSGHFSLGSTDMMLLPEAVPINHCVPVAYIEMTEKNLGMQVTGNNNHRDAPPPLNILFCAHANEYL